MDYATFESTCPACGADGALLVKRVALVASGEQVATNAELHADGFDIMPDLNEGQLHLEDLSTEDEEVECSGCQERFALAELLLDGQQEYLLDVEATVSARELVRAGSPRVARLQARRSLEQRPVYDCHVRDFRAQDARPQPGVG